MSLLSGLRKYFALWGGGFILLVIVASIVLPPYLAPRCVLEGTRIDTPDGPRRVESLKAGDAVWTRSAGEFSSV